MLSVFRARSVVFCLDASRSLPSRSHFAHCCPAAKPVSIPNPAQAAISITIRNNNRKSVSHLHSHSQQQEHHSIFYDIILYWSIVKIVDFPAFLHSLLSNFERIHSRVYHRMYTLACLPLWCLPSGCLPNHMEAFLVKLYFALLHISTQFASRAYGRF